MRATGSAPAGAAARPARRTAFLAAAALCAAGGLALGAASGRLVVGVGVAGCVAMTAAVLGGLVSWRASLLALLAYLPVSGIAILATYPHTGPTVLLKDFVFVIPAYLGFGMELLRGRIRLSLDPLPVALVTMLGVLVVAEALNPALPNRFVGAIGIKIWLFYIPLSFLGYHLVRERRDLTRLLALMSVSALVPVLIGVVEAGLFRAGHAGTVYRPYGDAAAVATGLFTELHLPSGGVLHRVPSTFSSWTQYYAFVLSMVTVTYAWWRGTPGSRRAALTRAALWLLVMAATFLSGARVAFIAVPAVIVATLALEQVGARAFSVRIASARLLAPVAVLVAAGLALGVTAGGLVAELFWKAKLELTQTFLHRFEQATHVTWLGLGTGIDTIASRYAAAPEQLFSAFGGIWYESWFVKVVLELGVPGFVLVVSLFAVMLGRGLGRHRRVRDPQLRTISAALLAFLFVNVLFAVSKPYIDNDPINVYFWLFAGLLAKVAVLDAATPAADLEDPG